MTMIIQLSILQTYLNLWFFSFSVLEFNNLWFSVAKNLFFTIGNFVEIFTKGTVLRVVTRNDLSNGIYNSFFNKHLEKLWAKVIIIIRGESGKEM